MLIMFRVKNFTSFKDETILDLRAVSYKEMKNHVIDTGTNKIVKTLAIYGKNASGKSNLISALYFFENFIINQFFADGQDSKDNAGRMPHISSTPFRLCDKINPISEYEMIFFHNGKTYQYGFSLLNSDDNSPAINEEWLLIDDDLVFERKLSELNFGKDYLKELAKLTQVRTDRLYIGTLDYFANGNVQLLINDIKDYLKNRLNVHFELILESSVKGLVSGYSFSEQLFKNTEYRKIVEQFVRSADIGITDLFVEKIESENGSKKTRYKIKTGHNVFNENGEIVGKEYFDLDMESSGTIRYLSFIQYVLEMMENGGVFIVDEISARLHPILTKFIVDLYQNENNHKAQLIFTTHDLSLMDRKQMRRDEIALVEKNIRGESTLYTLADIKTRSDASFSKDYLNGKYGAIPIINESILHDKSLEATIWAD